MRWVLRAGAAFAAVVLLLVVLSVVAIGGGGCGASSPSAPPPGALNAGQIVRYLEQQGLTANGAAGVVGNLEQESGLDPAEGDGNGGGGLAQWGASWYATMAAYATEHGLSPTSAAGQLEYLVYDLQASYGRLVAELNSATSPGEAARMFETTYELCSGVLGYMRVEPGSLCDDGNRRLYAVMALAQAGPGAVFVSLTLSPGTACAATPMTPGDVATILPDGEATIPQDAPPAVQAALAAGNRIIATSYSTERNAGMLTTVQSSYDCSGSTDWILYNAGLGSPQVSTGDAIATDSTTLESYGAPGPGAWITLFENPGHSFIEAAGVVMDTAYYAPVAPTSPSSGPRWQPASIIPEQEAGDSFGGFTLRHPPGL